MPIVKISSIYSVSSEDPSFPASNLLSTDHNKKWKCKLPVEESMNVVFQLPNSLAISGIDIGNEWSAFVEVLVAKNGARKDDDYKQILLTSSLMSVTECRNETNPNRVRCFEKNALIEDVAREKWDLVKIVCSQPFNRNLKYGLSFVKLHTQKQEAKTDVNAKLLLSSSSSPFARFNMREDSPDSESESSTSLFSRWKQSKGLSNSANKSPISAAAAIRQSPLTEPTFKKHSKAPQTTIQQKITKNTDDEDDDSNKSKLKNRNRLDLLYDKDDEKPNEKLEKKINHDREKSSKLKPTDKLKLEKMKKITDPESKFKNFIDDDMIATSQESNKSKEFKKTSASNDKKTNHSSRYDPVVTTISQKRLSSPIHAAEVKKAKIENKQRQFKPFSRLLEGVVLVISGIQNPLRAELRQKALELGAKYKPDWDETCTHLICAFKNTPKYSQVQGHGKIVTKEWITKCHMKKRRIPWREYTLDSDDEIHEHSEEEIWDETLRQPASPSSSVEDILPTVQNEENHSDNSLNDKGSHSAGSGSDTEDEIERILVKRKAQETTKAKDIYDVTTDEDTRVTGSSGGDESVCPLAEFFNGKCFFIADDIGSVDEIKLRRFISVYKGTLIEMANSADYIISNESYSTPSSFKGEVVKPLWVFECHAMESLLPTRRYLI